MNRLIHAGIFRLKKDKIYIGALTVVSLFTIFIYGIQYYKMMQADVKYSFDPFIFNFLIIIGIITAIFIPSFVGTEYSDGTIRNKLIVGVPRSGIYLSNLMTCILAQIVIVVVSYIVGISLGIALFGAPEMSSTNMFALAIDGVFLSLAYVSIFYMISMVSSSKSTSAVMCILIAFGIFFVSISIFSKLSESQFIEQTVSRNSETILEIVKNPYYLSGVKREIYTSILDLLPSGQAMRIVNQSIHNHGRMVLYSIVVIVVTSIIGITLFSRKDIK